MTADFAHLNDYILTSSFGTPLFKGHHSFRGKKFGPRKMFTQSLYLLILLFSGPEPVFNLHSGDTIAVKK